MKLTDVAARNAKPRGKAYKLSDGHGLHLLVAPTGGRLWRLAYRFDGKQRQLALGSYPLVSLAEARAARDAARKLLNEGVDPSAARRADRAAQSIAREATFKAVADDLLAKKTREKMRPRTIAKFQWLIGLAGSLHDRPVSDVKPADVLMVLQAVEKRGNHETAARLRGTISEVMRFAIVTQRADNDPAAALRGALTTHKAKHRAAILDAVPFGALLRGIRGYVGRPETRIALELLALTASRPGEIRLAEWREFDLSGDEPSWTIPAGRMKQGREHRAPLAPQAVALLTELRPLTGRFRLLFPGVRTPDRALSDNTLSAALRTLGYSSEEASAHGFRSTFSTMANESGQWNADAIEAALAHMPRDNVRAAYMRSQFWQERIRLMAWWADRCDAMREGGEVKRLRA